MIKLLRLRFCKRFLQRFLQRFLRDVSARGFCMRFLHEVSARGCVRVSAQSCAFDLPGFCEVSAGFLRGLCENSPPP